MRFKFKPNVNAPRGSSAAGVGSNSASAGARVSSGGDAGEGGEGGGGGGEVRRKRRRLRSRGDESTGTEGESASELESGETSRPRRQRRKTSEGSSSGRGGHHPSATTDLTTTSATLSLSTKDAESSRTERTQEPPSTIEGLHTAIDDRTQEGSMCTTVLPTAPQVESGPSKSASTREQISTNEKSMEGEGIHSVMHSSAGQMQSTSAGDSQPSPLGVLLTRGNSVATPGTGKTVPRIKKKVAPKVVSSRPKRTPRSAAAGTVGESASEPSSQPSSQQLQQEAETNATERTEGSLLAEREERSQSKPQEDDSSSPHRTHAGSESSNRTDRTQTSNNSSSKSSEFSDALPSPDATISGTLNEVLSNAHSREQSSTGLGNTVPTRGGVLEGVTSHKDHVRAPGDGDTIVVTSEESRHNEVEVRTNDKTMTGTAESDESFVVQGCTNTVERTASESPQSTTNKTVQTSASTSPPSSQEPQQVSSKSTSRRRRGGSAGPRSRRSESTASSVGSEAGGREGDGEGEKDASRTATKSKRRQKRKKASADSTPSPDEPSSLGASPSPKKPRASAVKVREAPDRSTMTMQELIYYNPSANPMSSSVEEKKRKKEEGQSVSAQGSRASSMQPSIGSRAASPANQDGRGGGAVGGASIHEDNEDGDRIVPTLRIGVDGKIVVDESSMMMETTPQEPLEDGGEIVLDSTGYTTSASYRQRSKVARWTKQETTQFFKALRQVGTDFTMMTLLLPKRSRRELKNKFKKEERSNPHLISQALNKT